MGPVDGVARLEAHHAPPALVAEQGPGFLRVQAELQEVRVRRTGEQAHRAADQPLALGVDLGDPGMRLGVGPVDLEGLLALVALELVGDLHDRQGHPVRRQGHLGADLDRPGQGLVHGQGHGQAPGEAARQVHGVHHLLVGVVAHEALKRAHGAGGDHLQVGHLPRAQGHVGQVLGLPRQLLALVAAGDAVDQGAAVGGDLGRHETCENSCIGGEGEGRTEGPPGQIEKSGAGSPSTFSSRATSRTLVRMVNSSCVLSGCTSFQVMCCRSLWMWGWSEAL